jgi:hypothetical protein
LPVLHVVSQYISRQILQSSQVFDVACTIKFWIFLGSIKCCPWTCRLNEINTLLGYRI